MRTVLFVERLELQFHGNVFSKAICLGDVDNDQKNELIVGNKNGELVIFKGSSSTAWRKAFNLGTLTCLEVGNICNHGKNYLFTSCVEGWCHIFDIKPDAICQDASDTLDSDISNTIKFANRQHLAANSKIILVADIDGDGNVEVVIGYVDRWIRSYRWYDHPSDSSTQSMQGHFELMEKWQPAGQLGSLIAHKCFGSNYLYLMASQPGGSYVTLFSKYEPKAAKNTSMNESTDAKEKCRKNSTDIEEKHEKDGLIYNPVGQRRAKNPEVATEIIGNISCKKKDDEVQLPSYWAICTLDGTFTLLGENKILWSIYFHHQLFTLTKIDVTGDGTDEVVACSLDGHTYIVSLNRDIIRFNFEENVAAFCCGFYNMKELGYKLCLIYVTLDGRIYIYHDINLKQISSSNLLEEVQSRLETPNLNSCFNCDSSNQSQMKELYHWCLYGLLSTQSKLDNSSDF